MEQEFHSAFKDKAEDAIIDSKKTYDNNKQKSNLYWGKMYSE
jgi:hypothetical protein